VALQTPPRVVAVRSIALLRVGMGLVIGGFLTFVFGNWFAITTGFVSPLEAALGAFVMLGIGSFLYARASAAVGLTTAGVVERSRSGIVATCPYCRTSMDASRSGIATCLYCETPFRIA
jgi:hypothetical protein